MANNKEDQKTKLIRLSKRLALMGGNLPEKEVQTIKEEIKYLERVLELPRVTQ